MKVQKKEFFYNIAVVAAVVAVLALMTVVCLNRQELKLNVADGQEIYVEYGDEDIPTVNAKFTQALFDPDGTEVEVEVYGEVDYRKLGTYTVTYFTEYRRKSDWATVTIVVGDSTPPEINLVSDPDNFTSPIAKYEEEGFKASDNFDGDLTDSVVREEKDGVVTYYVSDSSGNHTVVERKINYKDVVVPVINLNGGTELSLNVGTEYVEPGFVAMDDCDGNITADVQIEGTVDTKTYGTYPLTYKVVDSYGNECKVVRNVKVSDLQAPSLNLSGSKMLYIKLGGKYVEPGFSASDNVDGNITDNVTVSGGVNTSKKGTYKVNYSVTDAAGNVSNASRTIYVYEKQMSVESVNPGNKVVYLTFDDGPGAYTEKLLDILDKYGVKATFFVTNQRPAYVNMIGETYRRGHTVALHTYSHQYSIYTSEETYYADLKKINDIVVAQTGVQPTIVRFPGGTSNRVSTSYCKGIMTTLAQSIKYHGYLYCDWNVSSGDAGGTTSRDQVALNVINGIKSHNVSIVLQHDIKGYSVDAVEQILAWGLANGYTFLPMDETTPMVHHRANN